MDTSVIAADQIVSFFFQAEDGIRDVAVTGVQTCALPIFDWCFGNGRRLTAEQLLIYNSFMSKRGWRDDETDGYIPGTIKEYGLKNDGRLLTEIGRASCRERV